MTRRNYGQGRRLGYAGARALVEHYGAHDQYATRRAHGARFRLFAAWLRAEYGIRDARRIERRHVEAYGVYLSRLVEAGQMAVAYAQNRLSTVNRVLGCLRGDRKLHISPAACVGRRCQVRTVRPAADPAQVEAAVERLKRAGHARAACLVLLCRAFGMRLREAALADLDRLVGEAERTGKVRILEGTKGGRHSDDRVIEVGERQWAALRTALQHRPSGSRNLLRPTETWRVFLHTIVAPARGLLSGCGIVSFRELRAAFAVELYERESGQPAPFEGPPLDAEADERARWAVARQLGHGRVVIASAYIGGRR
ncbi:integrase domain-containing protein [Chromohalobacter canadensis]|uniref:Integrase domain-containing protein n=1 Tax=Chromohalobacter canadensis TaxID=141389 RepID=A0ABZ0Y6V8_9GAMM|nr:integrase domain-containing protein [Chromohalobacter canadensis]MCK0770306.1 integrase domain-containing protein [Chromohalobacter canadensis]WQH07770.1 integrase domain-containing protein [Chromohalobacter canadensis]